MERQEVVERLAVHAALGLHIVAKWMSEHDTVPRALKERLATHLMASTARFRRSDTRRCIRRSSRQKICCTRVRSGRRI